MQPRVPSITTRQTFLEVSVLPPVLSRSGALLRKYLDNAAKGGEHGHTAVLELGLAQPVSLSKQPTARHTPTPLILGQQERRRPASPSSATTPAALFFLRHRSFWPLFEARGHMRNHAWPGARYWHCML